MGLVEFFRFFAVFTSCGVGLCVFKFSELSKPNVYVSVLIFSPEITFILNNLRAKTENADVGNKIGIISKMCFYFKNWFLLA